MKTSLRSRATVTVAGALLLTGLAGVAPAGAKDGDVRVAGRCTARTTSKLKVKHDDGRIEAEFEVDSNRNGQRWSVRLTDQGVQVYSGTATTKAPSGSFQVQRRITNRAGTDVVRATASNAATGETCTATASI
ncbi:MAG: hypothetical protein JWM47_3499 [Acidimicrobiales bacterium]|nr:hypothetical protein [Acidimicrobiales bacterium]